MTLAAADEFLATWVGRRDGSERADAQSFLNDLCRLIGVEPPHEAQRNGTPAADYGFERPITFRFDDGSTAPGRIDLYKKNCFVLEAKQSSKRQRGGEAFEQLPLELQGGVGVKERPRLSSSARWDALMRSAKRQAEGYARCLDEWPPFVLVVDVGYLIEVYADFSRQGKNYAQFPSRNGFRIPLESLRDEKVRNLLKAIWENPALLDPAAHTAEVTQGIAALLARMTASMEARAHIDDPTLRAEHAYKVSKFLMRCIFAMFAEDTGLLPAKGFLRVIEQHRGRAERFHLAADAFFQVMDRGGYNPAIQADIRRFNGGLFRDSITVEVSEDELVLLEKAALKNWRNVEPAIFGTLLDQALSERERTKLGVHYTPRAYVERLVVPTIIEPLREDWDLVQSQAVGRYIAGDAPGARETVKRFHDQLCDTLVLDPACGTGNFLYVSLELMKRLEGEVLEFLKELGEPNEPLRSIDPHQFLGIEKNPRAVPITELVLWIGYIQWWFRTRERTVIEEPILRDFGTIRQGDAVLAYDREEPMTDDKGRPVTRQDRDAFKLRPVTGERVPDPDARLPVSRYVNPRPLRWPEADFIVGNPPFIGKGGDMRAELGDGYVQALWSSRGRRTDSIDFVMYWWDQAATVLRAGNGRLRRFGFITSNSITQVFSRRVLERHLNAERDPISLAFAIPDHPWIKQPKRQRGSRLGKKAAVRIAMTVAQPGIRPGKLARVVAQSLLDTDRPQVALDMREGRIGPDLTVGADVTRTTELQANAGLSWNGVMLAAAGFRVGPETATRLRQSAPAWAGRVRPFMLGDDLAARGSSEFIVDTHGCTEDELRRDAPAMYQLLQERVLPERTVKRDRAFRERWWLFGRTRPELRAALEGLPRYIGTTETAKHRVFQWIDAAILPDHMVVAIASADAYHLGVLTSRVHTAWALRAGARLGVGNDPRYSKSRCFDPFPFPEADALKRDAIGTLAEELDALRKRVIAEHSFLTVTRLYNVRERLMRGIPLTEGERAIHEAGCVGILHELHDRIDGLVAEAYGWPVSLGDEDVIARLVALNRERAAEERDGLVRWLRPDYQSPRHRKTRGGEAPERSKDQIEAELVAALAELRALPKDGAELVAELRRQLRAIGRPTDAEALAARYREGRRAFGRVERGLHILAAVGVAHRAPSGQWFVVEPSG